MSKHERIHIAVAFDQLFVTPAFVLLSSIFYHNKEKLFSFHVIVSGIDEQGIFKIKRFVEEHKCEIKFYEIDEAYLKYFVIPKDSYYTQATYYRLFFPSLLASETKKLLYIDTDTIVTGDLGELYQTNTDGLAVAACQDNGVVGLYERGKYFNAGVLLIDIPRWIADRVSEEAIRYLNDFSDKVLYVDQDALNFVLRDKWKKLDMKFNVTFNDIPPYLSKQELRKFAEDKVIVHFTGIDKPWSSTCANRLRFLYFFHLKRSPVSTETKYLINKPFSKKNILLYLKVRLIDLLCEFPVLKNGLAIYKSI